VENSPHEHRRTIARLFIWLPLPALVFGADAARQGGGAGAHELLSGLPLCFIENRGQADSRVVFYARRGGATVSFTAGGLTVSLAGPRTDAERANRPYDHLREKGRPPSRGLYGPPAPAWALKVDFVGADTAARPRAGNPLATTFSFFRGPRASWKTRVPSYESITYENLWPGIDLTYASGRNRLKGTITLGPGADPSLIRLAYRGATAVTIEENGDLAVVTPAGGIREEKPFAYQEVDGTRRPVSAAYVIAGDPAAAGGTVCTLALGPYDRTRTLVIDPPALVYCGYIGGNEGEPIDDIYLEAAFGIAVDSSGCAYVTGYTFSTASTFPETVGPDTSYNNNGDAFIAKVDDDGSGLVYCGYIGGGGCDEGFCVAVDSSGYAYIAGYTSSGDLPEKTNENAGGDWDAFVAKIEADGSDIIYSRYIGGSGDDEGRGVAVDGSGNAYVVGLTNSTESTFPETGGPDLVQNGGYDVFIAKVNSTGSALTYCGYIGGSDGEMAWRVAVNSAGNAFVTGFTSSTESTFPETGGPDLTHNGGEDAFIAKVEADGSALIYCGYIGGSANDEGFGLAIDGSGNAYVAGYTASTESTFPETGGPDLTYNGGNMDAFVAKVASNGASLTYCGYIGGSGDEMAVGLAVDSSGNTYVVGLTGSTESTFPETGGPDLTHNGGEDGFVAKVSSDFTSLVYCGYIGGSASDGVYSVAIDSSGNAYVQGVTLSTESTFPETGGPDLTHNGYQDVFVSKISDNATSAVFPASTSSSSGSGSTTLSWSHTVGAGSNRILVVGVALANGSSQTVSSVEYNGDSLTFIGSKENGTNVRVELWFLLAPDVGLDNTIDITLDGSADIAAGAVTFTGVNQTTPFDSFASATGTGTGPTVDASSAACDVVIDVLGAVAAPSVTAGSGQTLEWTAAYSSTVTGAQSVEGGAATTTMSHTLGSSQAWAVGAVSMNPASATAVTLVSFEAAQEETAVVLAWETGRETDNLGFHIWREENGKRERITRSIIPGSALTVGGSLAGETGHSYRFADDGLHATAWYWLPDVDLNGGETFHGPVIPTKVDGNHKPAAAARTRTAAPAGARRSPGRAARGGCRRPRSRRGPPVASPGDLGPHAGRGSGRTRRSAGGENLRARTGVVSDRAAGTRRPRLRCCGRSADAHALRRRQRGPDPCHGRGRRPLRSRRYDRVLRRRPGHGCDRCASLLARRDGETRRADDGEPATTRLLVEPGKLPLDGRVCRAHHVLRIASERRGVELLRRGGREHAGGAIARGSGSRSARKRPRDARGRASGRDRRVAPRARPPQRRGPGLALIRGPGACRGVVCRSRWCARRGPE
jgi:hypothetical protein